MSVLVIGLLIGTASLVLAQDTQPPPGMDSNVLSRDVTEDTPTADQLTVTITSHNSSNEFSEIQDTIISGTLNNSVANSTVEAIWTFVVIEFELTVEDIDTPITKHSSLAFPGVLLSENTEWKTANPVPSDLLENDENLLEGREEEFQRAIEEATGRNVSMDAIGVEIGEVTLSVRAYLNVTDSEGNKRWNRDTLQLKEPEEPWYLQWGDKGKDIAKSLWEEYGSRILAFIGINLVIGIIVGFLFKKIFKIALVIAIVLFLIWYFFGVAFVDFGTVKEAAAPMIIRIVQLLPLGIGLIIGIIIGFKIGK